MLDIKHIVQEENTCTMACIAMAADMSYKEVKNAYPEFNGKGMTKRQTLQLLERLNIPNIPYTDATIFGGRLYLVAVPSLNIPGGMHTILLDYTSKEIIVIDPNKGYPGRAYYTNDTLISWGEVIEFPLTINTMQDDN